MNINQNTPSMPACLEEIYTLFCNRYINLKPSVILNILIVKTAQMLTSKRILIDEVGRYIIPNWFSMVFVSSGFGKDRIVKDYNELVFKDFINWFKNSAKAFYDNKVNEIKVIADEKYSTSKQETLRENYISNEMEKFRNLVIEMQDGTQEGLYADAKAFKQADFGSLFITITEFGKYIQASTTDKELFINCLYQAYDGKILNKCTKTFSREADITDIPVNTLLYSDHNLILGELKHAISGLLQTGFSRRFTIGFQADSVLKCDNLSYEAERIFNNNAKKLGYKLFEKFKATVSNTSYKLLPESKEILNNYKKKCIDIYNNTDNKYLKLEINSRDFKALKLAGLYACLNHPTDEVINPNDVKQAISTVEFLSNDIQELLNYRTKSNDIYDRAFQFFFEHLGESFNKTELTYKHHSDIGISRDKFRKNFNEIIDVVKNIAMDKGYLFKETPINNNSGMQYCLIKIDIDNSLPSLSDIL